MSGIEAPGRRARREKFAAELTAALRASGLTLESVARRLEAAGAKTSVATLSYWQNGQSLPTRKRSMEVVGSLEEVLDLEQGALRRYLEDDPVRYDPERVSDGRMRALVHELDLPERARLQLRSAQDLFILEADRQTATTLVRQVVTALNPDFRVLTIAVGDIDGYAPEVVAGHGCRVLRSGQDQEAGLTVAGLELPRKLSRGDSFWLEYAIHWQPGGDDRDEMIRVVSDTIPILTSDVTFKGERPRTIGYRLQPLEDAEGAEAGADPISQEPLRLVGGQAQHVLLDAVPGEHVLHWAW